MLDSNGKLTNPEVRIEICNHCQARCLMCAHSKMTRPKGTMSNYPFKDLVKQSRLLGAKLISPFGFGEPLLDPQLSDKIQICTDLNLDTFITTNGAWCDYFKTLDLFKAGLGHLRISVHALNAENYKKVQPPLDWDILITNIVSVMKLKTIFPSTRVSITVIPMNGETIEEIKTFWKKFGIEDIEIWKAHNWSSVKNYRSKTEKRLKTCGRPFQGPVQIEWDGNVVPCCFLTNDELVLGNVHEKSIKEILVDEPYEELRRKHELGNLEGLPCKECDQLNLENKPVLLYSNRDPNCEINKTSSMKFGLMP